MTNTRNDVVAAAAAAFPESEPATVLAELDLYGIERHEPERERVQLAIVGLSNGNREKLREYVRTAKTDYRDILAWKELGPLTEAEGKRLQNEARALIEKWAEK